MLDDLIRAPLAVSPEFQSFRRQERVFTGLNLGLLAGLILAQFAWHSYLGRPHRQIVAILCVGVLAGASELIWINRQSDLSWKTIERLTWIAIAVNLAITFGLASYSYRQDIQYFALMIPPILQAAFRLPLAATIVTVGVSDGLIFFWVWNYFRVHPPADPNQYIEAGTIALVYTITGLLVWTLVNHLREKQTELAASLRELERAEARLRVEEKLAAVGRLSSAIAHEIRNPVAMISSALATAANRDLSEGESRQMYEIATQEASRLEQLTTDFLVYARPRPLQKVAADVAASVGYTAEICRPRAAESDVKIVCECVEGMLAEIDGGQLQQALLNLAMNAIEASPRGGVVGLRAKHDGDWVRIEIENAAGPIPAEVVACIFEPFFTTKERGTGLGLAIARNVMLGHGGDLLLERNDAELIRFAAILPAMAAQEGRAR